MGDLKHLNENADQQPTSTSQWDDSTTHSPFERSWNVYLSNEINSHLTRPGPLLSSSFGRWLKQFQHQFPIFEKDFFLCDKNGQLMELGKYQNNRIEFIQPQALTVWGHGELLKQIYIECLRTGQVCTYFPTSHRQLELTWYAGIGIPVYSSEGTLLALIGMIANTEISNEALHFFKSFALSYGSCVQLQVEKIESQRSDLLFQIAQKLYSMNDVDSVLTEVMDRLKQLYPTSQSSLFLSQDNSTSLSVKSLNFLNADGDICTRAFMEGVLIYKDQNLVDEVEIASPLSGKQGVYGVLHLIAKVETFDQNDIEVIRQLGRIAGSAFEKAKLYEQSNLMVHELRLINEITKRLNQSLKLNEIFNFASSELINIFTADFSCILQIVKDKKEMVVQACNLPAMSHEKFSIDYGFSGVVYSTKEPVIISDYWTNPKIKSKLMEVTGSRSLIASPILVNTEVVGVILVSHRLPNFFSYDNYKLLQVLSDHIGLTIANASLHAEVKRMVITDNLTGLYARHYLDEQVNYYQKKDFCGSLIVIDIDNFKRVNDTYGHQVGDKILIQVCNIIKTCIRDSDIAARWGGEELAVYLPQVVIDQTVRIAERVRQRVLNETNPKVTVSCGVSDWHWEDEKVSVELLFYKSDMALYKAKNEGKNQIKIG